MTLKECPQWIVKRALSYLGEGITEKKAMQIGIASLFTWALTPEGHAFWDNVCQGKFPPPPHIFKLKRHGNQRSSTTVANSGSF